MSYTVTISESADKDLEDILCCIAEDNLEKALSFIDELVFAV